MRARELCPEKQAPLRLGELQSVTHFLLQGFAHGLGALAVHATHGVQGLRHATRLEVMRRRGLRECGGVRIAELFAHGGARQHIGRRNHPAHAQTGGQHFAQRAAMDEPIAAARHLLAQSQQRRRWCLAKIQVAIRIVFHHNGLVLHSQLQHAQTACQAQGGTAGVAKSWNEVDQFGAVLDDQGFELIHLHALRINGHAHDLGAVQTKTLDGRQKSGRFHQGHIVGVKQGFGDQIQGLLASGGDNQTFRRQVFNAFGGHECSQLFAQRVVAFGGAVLQGSTGFLRERLSAGLANALDVKHGAVRKASRKTDDAGLAQQLEKFTNGRSFDVVEAISELHGK